MRCKWQKNFTVCFGGARIRASSGSAAPPPGQASVSTRHHRNTSRRSGNQWLPAQKLFPKWKDGTHGTEQNLLLPSRCGDVALVLGAWGWGYRTCIGTHSYSTTTRCKIFLSFASPFLLCCNASIYFSYFIFFSLLCCYRLRRWHFSWSTFRYILLFGLVIHRTLF